MVQLGTWEGCIAIWDWVTTRGENKTELKRRLTGHSSDLEPNDKRVKIYLLDLCPPRIFFCGRTHNSVLPNAFPYNWVEVTLSSSRTWFCLEEIAPW